jgi:hypothetical protein
MKTIKKIFISLICVLFTTASIADRIEIMPTSTLKGPHGTVIRLVTEITKSKFDFVPSAKNSCGEAVKMFNEAKGPIAITWSDTMYKNTEKTKQNCIINFDQATPIAVIYAPYELCVLPTTKLTANGNYKFGNNKFNPRFTQLDAMNSNKQGMKFSDVLYPSSGAVLQGLLNKEIDIGMIATGNVRTAIKKGTIRCLYTTGATKYGQRPVSEFYGIKSPLSEFRLGMMLFVRNFSPEQITKLKATLAKGNFIGKLENLDMVKVRLNLTKTDVVNFQNSAKEKVKFN